MTKIAIAGYGNVGKGVRKAIPKNPDMELCGIITRSRERVLRDLAGEVDPEMVFDLTSERWVGLEADVAILCGGSRKDLPEQGPLFASHFNTVDSFDTHGHIVPYIDEKTQEPKRGYFADMDDVAKSHGNVSYICAGWDPGTYSLERVLADAFIPGSNPQMFYGLTEKGGLSMGHSDAVRQLRDLGVVDARQYTHAQHEAIEAMRNGENPDLKPGDRVWREVYVVAEVADRDAIRKAIVEMPQYFKDYKTTVEFISREEMKEKHSGMPHDGIVLAVGETGEGNRAMIEYKSEWDSNPEATGSILVACARAADRFSREGRSGAYTILDFPAEYINPRSREELLGFV